MQVLKARQSAAQGDLLIMGITKKEFTTHFVTTTRIALTPEASAIQKGQYVVGHSETGHHHVIEKVNPDRVAMYDNPN